MSGRTGPHAQELLPDGRKRCSGCGQTLPLDCFARSRTHRTGHQSRCRACDKRRTRRRERLGPAELARIVAARGKPARGAFGRRLRQARVLVGLSTRALSALCGLDESYLRRLEYGERPATRPVVEAVAAVLDARGGLDPTGRLLFYLTAGFSPWPPETVAQLEPLIRAFVTALQPGPPAADAGPPADPVRKERH